MSITNYFPTGKVLTGRVARKVAQADSVAHRALGVASAAAQQSYNRSIVKSAITKIGEYKPFSLRDAKTGAKAMLNFKTKPY